MNGFTRHGLGRRGFLRSLAAGTVLVPALASRMAAEGLGAGSGGLAARPPLKAPKAKRVIFLYMSGGVSHVESWDPKPALMRDHGKTVSVDEFQGRKGDFKMFAKRPQWAFRPHGRCGTEVSELFRTWRAAWTSCA